MSFLPVWRPLLSMVYGFFFLSMPLTALLLLCTYAISPRFIYTEYNTIIQNFKWLYGLHHIFSNDFSADKNILQMFLMSHNRIFTKKDKVLSNFIESLSSIIRVPFTFTSQPSFSIISRITHSAHTIESSNKKSSTPILSIPLSSYQHLQISCLAMIFRNESSVSVCFSVDFKFKIY